MKRYLAIFLLILVVPLTVLAQTISVNGQVTDIKGEPIIGVNIIVKDVVGLGTITDINGKFTIKVEPYHRLLFSYVGYDCII